MASVACAIVPDKSDALNFDPAMIEKLCQDLGYHWKRKRKRKRDRSN